MKLIAWWMKANDPDFDKDYLTFDKPTRDQKVSHQGIELYTAPKELSRQEVESLWIKYSKCDRIYESNDVYEFAQELLKKASEK